MFHRPGSSNLKKVVYDNSDPHTLDMETVAMEANIGRVPDLRHYRDRINLYCRSLFNKVVSGFAESRDWGRKY